MADKDEPVDGSRPVSDPTALTTQQLMHEIQNLRTELIAHSDFNREIVETLIENNRVRLQEWRDTATEVVQREMSHLKTEVISHSDFNRQVLTERASNNEKQIQDLRSNTSEHLDRNIVVLREALEARVASVESSVAVLYRQWEERQATLEARFRDRDKRQELLADAAKLSVVNAFEERDKRSEQLRQSSQMAVDTAFSTAKETISKLESTFTKSIDAQQVLLNAMSGSIDDKISDLKDRLTTIESRTAGMTTANTENRVVNADNSARLMALLGVVISVAVGIGEIVVRTVVH